LWPPFPRFPSLFFSRSCDFSKPTGAFPLTRTLHLQRQLCEPVPARRWPLAAERWPAVPRVPVREGGGRRKEPRRLPRTEGLEACVRAPAAAAEQHRYRRRAHLPRQLVLGLHGEQRERLSSFSLWSRFFSLALTCSLAQAHAVIVTSTTGTIKISCHSNEKHNVDYTYISGTHPYFEWLHL
jgi:hypothetical protein